MKRSWIQRLTLPVLAIVLVVMLPGCGGSSFKKDARRLKALCDVVRGYPVTEQQAICIGNVFGVKKKKGCPIEVDNPDTFAEPVYRVRESCTGLGVVVGASNGRVLALVSNDEILYR